MNEGQPGYKLFCVVASVAALLLFSGMRARAATVPAEEIKAAVTKYIERNGGRPVGDIRVSFLSKVADENIPAEKVALKVSGRSGEDFLDYSSFSVGFYSGGSLLKERSVSVTMEALVEVVLSARSLPRGSILGTGDIEVRKKWMKNIPANSATLSEAVGKALTMTIGANREIMRNMLSEPTLIKRGKIVRIMIDNDIVRIATTGISEEEGRRNQIIRVKNLSSRKVIYARVTGGDTVLIDF